MKKSLLILLLLTTNSFGDEYTKFSGSYQLYSGELGDANPATKNDKKISLFFDKKLSKQLFDSIEPDLISANNCLADKNDRYRKKGDLECVRYHTGETRCSLGFDLIHGKSRIGSIC